MIKVIWNYHLCWALIFSRYFTTSILKTRNLSLSDRYRLQNDLSCSWHMFYIYSQFLPCIVVGQLLLYVFLTYYHITTLCAQFLVGCAHIRKQPLFEGVCETAFEKCKFPGTSDISLEQLADALRSSMLPPADDGVSVPHSGPLGMCLNAINISVPTQLTLVCTPISDAEAVREVWHWWRR